jgi:ATP-dependent Clp protease ATP-binding subunit ClpA
LFDEIEKAHPQVFNILLQILDDGRLTDSKGRIVNFKNTVIVMTSNVGSEIIYKMESFGFQSERKEESVSENEMIVKVQASLREQFKPEFLNRIDDLIIFHPLNKKILLKIANLHLELVQKRLSEKNIKLRISNDVKLYLTQKGFDPVYGARPLKRIIQNEILDELALEIIEKKIVDGDIVKIQLKNNKISFAR